MDLGSFIIGIVTGLIVASVGLETVIEVLKETITEAVPILGGLM